MVRIFGVLCVLLVLASTARADNGGVALMTGAVASPADSDTMGVEVRLFGGFSTKDPAIPNAYGIVYRQVGDELQTSAQWGWATGTRVGGAGVYARLMFDIISRDRAHGETHLSAFSPTADIGVAPFGHGICVSASAGWDIHFGAPDRLLVGAFVGMCGGKL